MVNVLFKLTAWCSTITTVSAASFHFHLFQQNFSSLFLNISNISPFNTYTHTKIWHSFNRKLWKYVVMWKLFSYEYVSLCRRLWNSICRVVWLQTENTHIMKFLHNDENSWGPLDMFYLIEYCVRHILPS